MIFGSVCSGIEAASVAWHPLGWKAAWLSEIEKFPNEVLKYHYPNIPNLGDMTKLHADSIFRESKIDLLVGGTPCQSFSVAGLRKGLSDPRGNLCLEFLRLVDIKQPRWFLWENVPGVLSSSRGRDFGSFIGAIQELGYGFVYRILDAQYFGVPQRRRRVFVVGYIGDYRPAAAVLFERESLRGDIAKGRKKRGGVAPTISARTKGGGGLGTDFDLDGGLIAIQERAVCENPDSSPNGVGVRTDGKSYTLEARQIPQAVCFSAKDYGADAGDKSPTLRAGGHTNSHANAGVMPAIAFNWMDNFSFKAEEEVTNPLRKSQTEGVCYEYYSHDCCHDRVLSSDGVSAAVNVSQNHKFRLKSQVRRLTPKEYERLQGFPDDYTLLPGKTADGPRYKALGNSMAVPCMRWIGERIQKVDDIINNLS